MLAGDWATTALIGANGFVVFFGATWGPVVWVLLGEMFPNRIRAMALAVAAAAQWVANFAVTMTFPPLSTFNLSFAYGIYAFMAAVSFFFVLRRVRETKGVELEDMTDTSTVERLTEADRPPWTANTCRSAAHDHLWMHFTQHSRWANADIPVIVRGEGAYIYDSRASATSTASRASTSPRWVTGAQELADAAAAQAKELAFHPIWSYAHPRAIELAERLAAAAPGDINRVFFTTGGSEAVESAWKLAKNYFKLTGKPRKHKVISRAVAYHGTTQGALSITGIPVLKQQFEPLVPSTFRVPNTNLYRASEVTGGLLDGSDPEAFGAWAAEQIRLAIEAEGPDTVAAVFLEPVQNAGGCFPPPPGYWQRVREICDEHDVLLVSDEVICAYGRLGEMFGSTRYGYVPDIITSAKGLTSGYSPMGAMLVSDRIAEPFMQPGQMFAHGYTWGGHPVSAAVALANLDVIENEGLLEQRARQRGRVLRLPRRLKDLPIVGDVRGDGYFLGGRAGARQGHARDADRRGMRAGPLRIPVEGAVGRRAVLPRRRPRRPRGAALAAADHRPDRVRRDRAILREVLTTAGAML